MLFVIKTPAAYALFTLGVAMLIFIGGISVKTIIKGVIPILWIVIITALLNLFMTSGEEVFSLTLFKMTLKITREGIETAALLTVRVIFLIIGTSYLTLTTPPLQLTGGIEKLLRPLNKIKVPSHEIAMMMTISIRFIPTLAEESEKIMRAQTARGADFESGNILKRAKAMLPIFIPLFVGAFRRAEELATAMEARCYRGGKNRTEMKETRMTFFDLKAGLVFFFAALVTISAEIFM
jgi:energy-coupling factor transport system permease protein